MDGIAVPAAAVIPPVSRIFLSVDVDEWYQGRWATGSARSRWPDHAACFRECYGMDRPAGEVVEPTRRLLDLFDAEAIAATFFFTGEIAGYYPELVREVVARGHEIGCHNMYHRDFGPGDEDVFCRDLAEAKARIEDVCGQKLLGYRGPNAMIQPYMIEALAAAGFLYDSSVMATWVFRGKYGGSVRAPVNPYRISPGDFTTPGDGPLWEFPWPVFPVARLPAGSAIMTRMAGYAYSTLALDAALKSGHSSYYLHPYELAPAPVIAGLPWKVRFFFRNSGRTMEDRLRRLLARYRGRFSCGRSLLAGLAEEAGVPSEVGLRY